MLAAFAKSAPGEDGLSFKTLGNLHARALKRLRDIIQVSIKFGEVPDCWKTATVVLIPKKGKNPGLLANKRPISLLNTVAKISETRVKKELQRFLEENIFSQ